MEFAATLSDLEKGIYYVKAYAKNRYGVTYGKETQFEVER